MFCFIDHSSGGTLKLCSPPVGSLGRRKQRAGPSPTPPNNVKAYDCATTGRMHRRHSSSDDRLAQGGKEEVSARLGIIKASLWFSLIVLILINRARIFML